VGLYKVVFLGMAVAGPEEETRLIGGLQKKFNLSPERAESLLQRVPIVVKKGVSQEEAERYVRAFEEIGGRVKVEEEPISHLEVTQEYEPKPRPEPGPRPEPKSTFAYGTEPEGKPYKGKMVTCPQCGFEQPGTDECIKCGIIISKYIQYQEMDRLVEGKIHAISEEEYTPWEGKEGFISAFFQTVKESLFSSTRFFKKVSAGEGYWTPLIYSLICGIVGVVVPLIFVWLIFRWLLLTQFFPVPQLFLYPYGLILSIFTISLPFGITLSILISSAVTHLCLMIVGGNKKGFQRTFRAVAYSGGIQLFGFLAFLPFIGGIFNLLLLVYYIILLVIGVREGHVISTGKAVLAVLLPLIVVAGLGILAAILIPLLLGSMGFFGGVRL
jgi:hypothetical protein